LHQQVIEKEERNKIKQQTTQRNEKQRQTFVHIA